jgi:hypothetical protein
METKIYEFDPVIYPRLLWIAVNPQGSNLKEYFEDYDFTFKQQKAICCGVTKRNPRESGFLIVFKSKKYLDADTIAHEASHVAMDLFNELGIEFDGTHQEALSYFIGWVAKCCEQVKKLK